MTIELLSLSSSLSIQSNLSLLTKGAIDEGAIDAALIERQEKTTVSLGLSPCKDKFFGTSCLVST